MDITVYLKPLFRWWRLIVVVTLLAFVSSAISTLFQPAQYVSKATLMIGSTILNPNPDSSQIYIAQQLAEIYADMANREPIQEATMLALGINWLPQYQSRVVPNTQLIEIAVTDTNPQRAQIIANELANQMKLKSPTVGGNNEVAGNQEFIKQQLSTLEGQIKETQKKIEALQTSLVGVNSASQTAKIQKDINDLNQKLAALQANYGSFLANSQGGALNILSIVEPANLPTGSVGANKFLIIVLASMLGFSLGSGAAYLLEYLDRTIKTTSDVERVFGLPVIGYISEISNEEKNKAVVVSQTPNSILAENFRLLRSNIEFFQISNPIKTILITSPNQGNGKTTIASNLAISISQGEQEVILVDADLRRPAVHTALGMSREPGLSDVIRNKAEIQSVVRKAKDLNINVITAGNTPPNITEVVGSKRISSILSRLKDNYELVIVDAPPLIIADSFNLASKVDGVILVITPGETTIEQAKVIKEQLDRSEARMLGIVFNKITAQTANSYGDYQYQSLYSPQQYGDYIAGSVRKEEKNSVSPSKKIMAFFEHGEVPDDVVQEVEHAITAIKTQPRNMVNKMRKPKKNGKSS